MLGNRYEKIKKAYKNLHNFTDAELRAYQDNELARMDYEHALETANTKGMEKGMEQGKKEKEKEKEMINVMLSKNIPIETISEISGWKIEEIKKLAH